MDRGFAAVIAACTASEPETVIGFYTLCAAAVPLTDIPDDLRRKMPRYHSVPAIHLGRLAVGIEFQSRRTGTLLLIDAIVRVCRTELAWAIFCVDAKNERSENFYKKMLFKPFHTRPHSLWMHRKQAIAIVSNLPKTDFLRNP
ncbi:MAG: GNAT family N-acetyltransferase [Desulfovibrio sp.]|nr:GNAT family N-acetyltransferase [Desulfovibrio sp.]